MNHVRRLFVFSLLMGLAVILLGCAPAAVEPHPLENTLWEAESVILSDGTEILFDPMRTTTIYFREGQAAGRTACNFYTATYTIDDRALNLSAASITEAECLNDAMNVQERIFIDKVFSSEIFAITNDELTLIYPGGSVILRAQPDTRGDEAAVYASVLREWQGDNLIFVIINDTAFNAPGIPLETTLENVQAQMQANEPAGIQVEPSTLEDFRAKNAESHPLEGIFPADYPIQFMKNEFVASLFASDAAAGWEAFYAQYPEATSIFSLSRVGFSTSGDQALVHLERMSQTDSGNFYHLLTHNNGIWVSNLAFRLENP